MTSYLQKLELLDQAYAIQFYSEKKIKDDVDVEAFINKASFLGSNSQHEVLNLHWNSVYIFHSSMCGECRSLFDCKPIKAGECMLKVPHSVKLTQDSLPPKVSSLLRKDVSNRTKLALVILLHQKLGQASKWDPYMSSLPPDWNALTVVLISLGRALFNALPLLPITHGMKCNGFFFGLHYYLPLRTLSLYVQFKGRGVEGVTLALHFHLALVGVKVLTGVVAIGYSVFIVFLLLPMFSYSANYHYFLLEFFSRSRSPVKPERSTERAERRSRSPRRIRASPPPSKGMKRNPSPEDGSLAEKEKEAAINYLDGVIEKLRDTKESRIEEPIFMLLIIGCRLSTIIYKSALLYLAYTSVESLSDSFKLDLAFDLSLSALLGENVYNFGELLAHPIVESARDKAVYQGFREYDGRVKIESRIYRCKPINLSYYTSTRKRANVLIERNMTDYGNLSGPEIGFYLIKTSSIIVIILNSSSLSLMLLKLCLFFITNAY
ncbi:26S proteasome non-ATPase regulatory subunit 13 homolog A [Tanacetum coccineum]